MPTPKRRKPARLTATAGFAAMLAIAVPFSASWEGKRNDPYVDVVGVKTVCYGETRGVEERTYSDAECDAIHQTTMTEFALAVAELSPDIVEHPIVWAAMATFASNVGKTAYAKSSVRREFNQGNHAEACRRLLLYKYGGGRVIRGLVHRRAGKGVRIGEHELCMTGVTLGRIMTPEQLDKITPLIVSTRFSGA